MARRGQAPSQATPAKRRLLRVRRVRLHAALGEHSLSVSVLDAALEVATATGLLYSEAMAVRQRAVLGIASGTPHWDERTGKEHLVEVIGRMAGDKQLHEKLLLHGL